MKRFQWTVMAAAAGTFCALPALAGDRAVIAGVPAGTDPMFPLHRDIRVETDIGPRGGRGVTVNGYLPVVNWRHGNVGRNRGTQLSWEDRETFSRRQGWTRVYMNVGDRGNRLLLDIDGRMQIDYAEIVFGNGRSQVVDFRNRNQKSGLYELIDFRDGRKVDHVKLVARAVTRQASITLKMEKAPDQAWNQGRNQDGNQDRNRDRKKPGNNDGNVKKRRGG